MEKNNLRIPGLVTLAVLPIWIFTLKLSLHRVISTDEFTFLHASWLMADGLVPVRDFYLPLPFFALLLAPLWKLVSWNFAGVLMVRSFMHFFLFLSVAAGAFLTPKAERNRWWVAVILLLTTPSFVRWMTEVRPDAAGFAFFLTACAIMGRPWMSPRPRALAMAALLTLSMVLSIKAVVYAGVPIVIAITLDAVFKRGVYFLNIGSLLFFVLGCAGVLAAVSAYWSWSYSLSGWLSDLTAAVWRHETVFPHKPWTGFFASEMLLTGAALPFAVAGMVTSFQRRASTRAYLSSMDFFLALCLLFSFVSIVIQRAPFPHSVVPFAGLLAVLAARGMAPLLSSSLGFRILVFVSLAANSVFAMLVYDADAADSNRAQRELVNDISRLTSNDDVMYDNAGEFVVRRSAWYYFFTDDMLRRVKWGSMRKEVSKAMAEGHCVGWVKDSRFQFLPEDLQAFLTDNYVEYRDNLFLAGWRFSPEENRDALSRSISVIKGGTYFLTVAGERGPVSAFVDGRKMDGTRVDLEPGAHEIKIIGRMREARLLWLPKDHRTWGAP